MRRGLDDALMGVWGVRPGEVVTLPPEGAPDSQIWWVPGRLRGELLGTSSSARFARALTSSCARSVARGTARGVPLLAMSGGLDSCALAGIMHRELDVALEIASIVFPEHPGSDESGAIELMTEHLGLPVVTHAAKHSWFASGLTRIMGSANQSTPALFPSELFMPTFLKEAAGGSASTIWLGLGADQLLATLPAHLDPRPLSRRAVWRRARARCPLVAHGLSFARHFSRAKPRPHEDLWARFMMRTTSASEGARRSRLEPSAWRQELLWTWSWEASMRELRRTSRALNVPMEAPFLDRALWDVVSAMSAADTWNKRVLRDASQHNGWAPATIAHRSKSTFFDAFVAQCLLDEPRILEALERDELGRGGYAPRGCALGAWHQWKDATVSRIQRPLWTLRMWRWISMTLWVEALDRKR
ncbi:MAG: asparagine synthase C-terminal domain-containing protein [Myxococcota bacterium]